MLSPHAPQRVADLAERDPNLDAGPDAWHDVLGSGSGRFQCGGGFRGLPRIATGPHRMRPGDLLHADRNGMFYVLDRTTGEFLLADKLSTKVTWVKGFTKEGKPIVDPGSIASKDGVAACPGGGVICCHD